MTEWLKTMCGRFACYTPTPAIAGQLGAIIRDKLPPRYNIAPSQRILAVRQEEDGRRSLAALHWGLVPFWAKDTSIGNRMINARAETLGQKPAFRQAVRKRRCLIPADGFYEWQRTGSSKQPYYLQMADTQPFCFAGLWESWQPPEDDPLESCTILTTDANDQVRPIHHRMPVILTPEWYDLWLDPAMQDPSRLQGCLHALPNGALRIQAVSSYVNNPRNDDRQCLTPASE